MGIGMTKIDRHFLLFYEVLFYSSQEQEIARSHLKVILYFSHVWMCNLLTPAISSPDLCSCATPPIICSQLGIKQINHTKCIREACYIHSSTLIFHENGFPAWREVFFVSVCMTYSINHAQRIPHIFSEGETIIHHSATCLLWKGNITPKLFS